MCVCIYVDRNTSDDSKYAPLHVNMNSRFLRGLRRMLGLELGAKADFSICHTKFASRVSLWGSQGLQASYVQC